MPFTRYDTTGLTSMREVARLVGMSESWFWRLVYEVKLIPAPTIQVGQRLFYGAQEVKQITQQVIDLRRQGRCK